MSDPSSSARILALSQTLRSTISELQALASSGNSFPDEAVKSIQSSVLPLRDLTFSVVPANTVWREHMWMLLEQHPLRFAVHFKLARHVPLDGTASLSELSQKTGVPRDYLGRIMRMLVTMGAFERVQGGGEEAWKHNAMSRGLAEEGPDAIMDLAYYEISGAAVNLEKWVKDPEAVGKKTLWEYTYGKNIFDWHVQEENKERAAVFAACMKAMATKNNAHADVIEYLKSEGVEKAKLVDVGGGNGHVSLELGKALPNFNFVVQDRITAGWDEAVLLDNVQFQQHDFFTPQPVTDADYYYYRYIFHDWPDAKCVEILNNAIPALKGPSVNGRKKKLLINDSIMATPGEVPRETERLQRLADLVMAVVHDGKERDPVQWKELADRAKEKLKITEFRRSTDEGETLGLVVVELAD